MWTSLWGEEIDASVYCLGYFAIHCCDKHCPKPAWGGKRLLHLTD